MSKTKQRAVTQRDERQKRFKHGAEQAKLPEVTSYYKQCMAWRAGATMD